MEGQEESPMMAAGGGGAGWPGSGLLSAALRGISGMVQSFLTSSLNWEDFLEALHTPEQLKAVRANGLHVCRSSCCFCSCSGRGRLKLKVVCLYWGNSS